MAGAVGNYSDGETIHGGDLNADLTSLLGNDARLFLDIFAGWNILVSGFALTAGAGMAFNIASGLAYASGVRLNMTSGSVTLAAGNTQPRYDVIWVQAGKTAGTNPTTSNPTQSDSGTFGVQAGTPGSSPTVPALGDPTKVQVGTVYVPANATTASGCTPNSQVTAPNAQGPVKTLVDLLTHIAANITSTSVVHGVQQGSGHGFDADTVDGSHASAFDAAGAAGAVAGNLTTESASRTAADASIRADVTSGALVAGQATAAGNATHLSTTTLQRGTTATAVTDSNGNAAWSVTFAPTMSAAPTVIACAANFKPGNASICETQSVSVTGCTIQLCFASNSGATVQASYIANAN